MSDNKISLLKIIWQDSRGKELSYYFDTGKLIGLRVTDEGYNYINWKKFFYGMTRTSPSLRMEIFEKRVEYTSFIKEIKNIVPRPVPRFAEELSVREVIELTKSINNLSKGIEHPLLSTCAHEKWSSLPIHRKMLLQILASIDIDKKIHLIFFERSRINQQQAQHVYEILKSIISKFNLCIVALGDPQIFPQFKWVPLLKAPVLNIKTATLDIEENEDYHEDVA